MAEKQLQAAKSGVAPVNAHRQRHIKIRVPIALRVILPLAATLIIFQGCAGASQTKKAEKEVNGMGNQELFIKPPNTTQADTLKLTPVKTEGKEKRDSLLKARINELAKESAGMQFTLPEKGVAPKPTKGTWAEAAKELDFGSYEQLLCHAGIDGDQQKIAKYKDEIRKLGVKYGDENRADGIIKNFEKIMQMK